MSSARERLLGCLVCALLWPGPACEQRGPVFSSEPLAEAPEEELWFDLGGSDLGPRSARLSYGSACGAGLSRAGARAGAPHVAVDPAGVPHMIWYEGSTLRVMRHGSAGWRELGPEDGSSFPGSMWGSIAVDGEGRPLVAGAGSRLWLKRFDGHRWVNLLDASSRDETFLAGDPFFSLVVDSQDRPMLVWAHGGDPIHRVLYVSRLEGDTWVDVGAGSMSGNGVSGNRTASNMPSLALGFDDLPVLAWVEIEILVGKDRVFVKRFDGEAWAELGEGSASGSGIFGDSEIIGMPSLVVGPDGAPVLGWQANNAELRIERFDGQRWQTLTSGLASEASLLSGPQLVTTRQGRLVLVSELGATGVLAAQHSEAGWVELGAGSMSGGGISGLHTDSRSPTVAAGSGRELFVAWQSWTSNSSHVYLRRFDGSTWHDMPASVQHRRSALSSQGASSAPWLAMDAAYRPAVAWLSSSSGQQLVMVARYDGRAWSGVPAGSALALSSQLVPRQPRLAVRADRISAAWTFLQAGQEQAIFVQHFDGRAWTDLLRESDPVAGMSGDVYASAVSMVLDQQGWPIVAWCSGILRAGRIAIVAGSIFVRRFDGRAWQEVGEGSASGQGISGDASLASSPSVAVDAHDQPLVAWMSDYASGPVVARRFDGQDWVEVGGVEAEGGVPGTSEGAYDPRLMVDALGRPVLSWMSRSSDTAQIYLRRFDGQTWLELSGSATGGGVSSSQAGAGWHQLAADGRGRPVVAWQDSSSGFSEVYLRYHDGETWAELDGSATGGGISNSAASSSEPSLAVADDLACVAWIEPGCDAPQVALRCAVLP